MSGGFLVYVRGDDNKPVPQKWPDWPSPFSGYWKLNTIHVVALTAEDFVLPIDKLAAKFPAPVITEDALS